MQTPKQGFTCGLAAQIETDELLTLLRRESATLRSFRTGGESSHCFVTLAAERFSHLGKGGSELIDQLATSIVGGTGGGENTFVRSTFIRCCR